jgi:hypothetical protein
MVLPGMILRMRVVIDVGEGGVERAVMRLIGL